MAQRKVWHVDEVGQVAATLLVVAPTEDFAAGVLALRNAIGAPVPARRRVAQWGSVVEVTYQAGDMEVTP
jgi:hypothetical protein